MTLAALWGLLGIGIQADPSAGQRQPLRLEVGGVSRSGRADVLTRILLFRGPDVG